MKKIRIAGVPEHFNTPWYEAIESGAFAKAGLSVQWIDVPEGTGKMCQMLREGEVDIALLLTEGIVRDIAVNHNPARLWQWYVASPLQWGIHVAAQSAIETIEDLQGQKVAISRMGSGSHLMAFVHAQSQGWTPPTDFEIVHTIEGAVTALTAGKADYFMWEKIMTQPLVDQGIFRRVGVCPTPWPCFVMAVHPAWSAQPELLEQISQIINAQTIAFKNDPTALTRLQQRFPAQAAYVETWLHETQWSQDRVQANALAIVQNTLLELGLIDRSLALSNYVVN